MSNPSRRLVASHKYEGVGPDYFGYYSSEVANLLSEEDDVLPVATRTFELPPNKCGEGGKSLANHCDTFPCPMFSNGVGATLSDFKKDRLRSLLIEGAVTLSSEVDEVVDPVFSAYHLQSGLRSKTHSLNHMDTTAVDAKPNAYKKQKVSPALPMAMSSSHAQTSDANRQCCRKVSDDLQFLLENASVEMMTKYSDQLSGTLGHMEQHLELLLGALMSKCRPMTLCEKQQLQRLIQKLPPRNLDRVVEIINQSRSLEEKNSDEIFVDLEKEDNATLWRLYYYVDAVEKAKILSGCEETI